MSTAEPINKHIHFKVDLTIAAPVLSNTTGTLAYGVDASMQIYAGQAALNGSLLRGNLRHVWEKFADLQSEHANDSGNSNVITHACINRWLGSESSDGVEPNRARLNFDYFWLAKLPDKTADDHPLRYRIRVDDATGTVADGALQVIETPFQVGDKPTFSGGIYAVVDDDAEAKRLHHWLDKALRYLNAIGAYKGIGFGQILETKIKQQPHSTDNTAVSRPEGDCWRGRLRLDRPFCIAAPHLPNSNRFIGQPEISGSVIKGALAQMLDQQGLGEQLRAHDFDDWRIGFALPVKPDQDQRPKPIPLSLVQAKLDDKNHFFDLAKQNGPGLLASDEQHCAPSFQIDWKYSITKAANTKLNKDHNYPLMAEPERQLSVHTGINIKTNAALDKSLFSLECIDPNGVDWDFYIDFSRLSEDKRTQAQQWLFKVLQQQPINGIGKTKARAEVHWQIRLKEKPASSSISPVIIDNKPCYIAMLATPARMLGDSITLETLPATANQNELKKAYAQYFKYISDGSLNLSHYYATQQMIGGAFYWQHYRGQTPYRPEWLTQAGSVFVLNALDEQVAGKLLQNWQKQGLPVAEDREQDNWQSDPYRPENGYGEIVINDAVHSQLSPGDGEWHDI